jgi:predicted ribosomally synthesized peptide with nif11-like leader
MSKESLEQFMNQVAESEELQVKIGEEIDADALIALGAQCGCEFTADELQESMELSDEELEGVSGGFNPSTIVSMNYTGNVGFKDANDRRASVVIVG